jgi:hypothetical protein
MIVFDHHHWNLSEIYQQIDALGVTIGQDYHWSFSHPDASWAVEFVDSNAEMFYAVKLAFQAEGITWIKTAG